MLELEILEYMEALHEAKASKVRSINPEITVQSTIVHFGWELAILYDSPGLTYYYLDNMGLYTSSFPLPWVKVEELLRKNLAEYLIHPDKNCREIAALSYKYFR